MKIKFVLIGEGSSDLRMKPHIENILIREGFSEVSGEIFDVSHIKKPIGKSVSDKLKAAKRYFPSADLFVVHRDADNSGSDARFNEISGAASELKLQEIVVPMIPVKMMETWLLVDSDLIFKIAGKNNQGEELKSLPSLKVVEKNSSPKDVLMEALCEASGLSGGKLSSFKKRFNEMRARIMEDLSIDGRQNNLPSYRKFRDEISSFSRKVLNVK